MDALMSHLLLNAARSKQTGTATPVELTWNKSTQHTCDRLVNQEDLRPTTDVGYSWSPHRVISTPRGSCDSYSSDSSISSVCSEESIYIKREVHSPVGQVQPHPFSIEALLGDSMNCSSDIQSAPAVVYSAYSQGQVYQGDTVSNLVGTNDVAFWCHVCNALCTDIKDAQGHQYLHQMQGIRSNLKYMLFSKFGYVTKHVKLDDERIQCGLCDKIVAQCFFTKHQRLHDGHFCEVCQKELPSNSRLQDHMNIHTGKTPFTCKICDRQFSKRSSLTQHQRYHRDHQSFHCNFCPKSFNSKYARAVHERLHTGDNPFKCMVPGCSRAFPQKIQLKLHMHSH